MRLFAILYCLGAATVAIVTTFMQVQPALFFIDLVTDGDNMFSVKLAMLLTMLALFLPLVVVMLVIKALNKSKNQMPDTTGRTGIIVHRKKALSNALYDSTILVNSKPMGSVSNGKSTFIELTAGNYQLQVKGHASAQAHVNVEFGKINELQLSFVDDGGLKVKVMLEEIEQV